MDFFSLIRFLFGQIGRILSFHINLGGYFFSIGSMVIGLIILSCSVSLLAYLFRK